MNLTVRRTLALLAFCALLLPAVPAQAQSVTTGSIAGTVADAQKAPIPGATVTAVHEPSGTRYETTTHSDGRYSIPGVRVGGPYTVTATLSGFQPVAAKDVIVNLGVAADVSLTLSQLAGVTEEITVTAVSDSVFSSSRTGAATTVAAEAIATMPTINDRINDFARLSPQYSGGPFSGSFVGQDNRLNNITIDGSYFNNSFGLAGQPGDRTGVAPVSMAAIQEIQINTAPYDVRQGHFVGAGVNSITKSGDNGFRGSAYYWFRDDSLVGTEAKDGTVNPGTFDFKKYGGWISGPILKDKLFFFGLIEDETYEAPGTTFRANTGSETVGGSVTRVRASDLDALSSFLSGRFGFETGAYENYPFETPARRYMGRLDWNVNDRNKVSLRYIHLDSDTDVLTSTSSSLGFGRPRTTNWLGFQNSNYTILENIRNFIGEWNSILGSTSSNTLIVGYSKHDESRGAIENLFPFVDILEQSTTYTSFGSEPFTPNNELRYSTFQIQDYFTTTRGSHSITFGASAEYYESENVFFPGQQSVYVYNSLADFYTDANGYLANPNRTTSPVNLRRFQVRWNNIPGQEKPIQPLEVWYTGVFAQDEWQVNRDFKLIYGIRFDVPFFGDTGFANANADALTFRNEDGSPVQYQTGELPDANVQISPRAGFNWDVNGDRSLQVRGGSGILSGPPIYVWLSNQIGNTGVLTGFQQLDNTTARPFNPNPATYKPATVTGEPASSYELAVTDPDFKFPQVWRSNLAVDKRLAWGLVGTLEGIYSRDINGIYYIDANLPAAQTAFVGADNRPRWTSRQIYSNVSNNTVMKNQSEGYSWHLSAELQKRMKAGFVKTAYSYGVAKNTIDPGSIARGSWTGNAHSGDPNNPGAAYSSGSPGHRFLLAGSYRFDWFKFGATTFSLFFEGFQGNTSYVFSGDLNGDGGTSNDLLYIHRDASEMNFQTFTSGGRTYTAADQAAAWDAYINQDKYLSKHRGEYAERGAVFSPMTWRADFTLAQDLFTDIGGKRHALQARMDVFNFTNLLNKNWGVGQSLISNSPLTNPGVDSQGRASYRMRVVNNQLMSTSWQYNAGLSDVYRIQFSFRYTFN